MFIIETELITILGTVEIDTWFRVEGLWGEGLRDEGFGLRILCILMIRDLAAMPAFATSVVAVLVQVFYSCDGRHHNHYCHHHHQTIGVIVKFILAHFFSVLENSGFEFSCLNQGRRFVI